MIVDLTGDYPSLLLSLGPLTSAFVIQDAAEP